MFIKIKVYNKCQKKVEKMYTFAFVCDIIQIRWLSYDGRNQSHIRW